MAMSDTMSGSGDDWVQFYHHHGLSGQPSGPANLFSGDRVSDATIVTTAVTSASVPGGGHYGGNSSSSGSGHLNAEGRVSKPIRRRSRASRRTPTTLLNTDTTNFRAMVQQFTGGPCGPFSPGAHHHPHHHPGPGAFTFNFGARPYAQGLNPMHGVVFPAGVGHHVPFQRQPQPQPQQQQQQQHQYMLSLSSSNNNNNNNESSGGGGDTFFQRLTNPPARANAAVSEGFGLDGVSSRAPPHNNSSDDVRTHNGFMF